MGILHRRHLRLKTLHALYANHQNDNGQTTGLKNLKSSVDKVYEMYILLLRLLADLKVLAEERSEQQKSDNKTLANAVLPEDIFAKNQVLVILDENPELAAKVAAYKIDWFKNDPEIVDKIYRTFARTEAFKSYIQEKDKSLKTDLKLVVKIFKQYVVNNEGLQKIIEEKSIYWIDDLDLVAVNVLKTLDHLKSEGEQLILVPLYKDFDEDSVFLRKLFLTACDRYDEFEQLIESYAKNWDIERIALMDRLIMVMAIAELMSFPDIPVKVSLNEYIDLAKEYSTNKSKNFVNGILDKVITKLKEDGEIKKTGRGLLE